MASGVNNGLETGLTNEVDGAIAQDGKREPDVAAMEAIFGIGYIPYVKDAVLDDTMATQELLNPRRR